MRLQLERERERARERGGVKKEPTEEANVKMVKEERGGQEVDLQELTGVVERALHNVNFILPFDFYT